VAPKCSVARKKGKRILLPRSLDAGVGFNSKKKRTLGVGLKSGREGEGEEPTCMKVLRRSELAGDRIKGQSKQGTVNFGVPGQRWVEREGEG